MATEKIYALAGTCIWVVAMALGTLADTHQPWLTEIAWVGDALAPLGAIATFVALVHAFRIHESAETKYREDREARSTDRLAEAYAAWLSKASESIVEMHSAAVAWKGTLHLPSSVPTVEQTEAIESLSARFLAARRSLYTSPAAVLLFETKATAREEILGICRRGIVPPTMGLSETHKLEAERFRVEVRALRTDFERFADNAAVRFGGTGGSALLTAARTESDDPREVQP